MPEGTSWGSQFPPIVNHTSSAVARHHPDFKAAKHGDFQAALRLVDELVKDEKIAMIARNIQMPTSSITIRFKEMAST